jgi:LacI family transcriptional regulator
MVDYFVEKGHKRIGFIGGSDRNIDTGKPSMDIREWSFRQSAAYYGYLNEEYIFISERFTVDDGYRMGKELLKKEILPTALCVASDTLAVGVLQALNEGNIQIPEQVAVFSINDVNIAKYLSPPLTTIHIDIPCICETALDLLRNRVLYGGRVTKLVFVNGIPVFRKSC